MTYNVVFSKQFNAAGEGTDYPTDSLIVPYDVDVNPLFIEMRLPVPSQTIPETGEHRCMCSCGCVAPPPAEILVCDGCLESDDDEHYAILCGEEEWQYTVEDELVGYFEGLLDRCETVIRYAAL